MSNKYNNTVILSKGGEHGKRVIEWWEKHNVDTGFYLCNESGFYFGLIDGEFGIYTLSDVAKANAKIIELPESNPQIIDLSNVEGVEMMVSENNRFWVIKKIICKYKYSYVDEDMFYWRYAKPIEYTYLTLQDISDGKGVGVDPELIKIKEVNNEQ